jgi:hypothetical protein
MAFLTEADTCRRFVLPKLYAAGWTDEQISEQRASLTAGSWSPATRSSVGRRSARTTCSGIGAIFRSRSSKQSPCMPTQVMDCSSQKVMGPSITISSEKGLQSVISNVRRNSVPAALIRRATCSGLSTVGKPAPVRVRSNMISGTLR